MSQELVLCTVCERRFNTNSIEIKQETLEDARTGLFFVCPHCEAKYTIASITPEGLRLKKQINVIVSQMRYLDEKDVGELDKLVKAYKDILDRYRKEVTGPYE